MGVYARECDMPTIRADHVDAQVWSWVKSFLMEPEVLEQGLLAYQQERETESAPMRARLEIVNDLLADERAQLERLLDLYLSRAFPKDVLTDRKARIEETIASLVLQRNVAPVS